VSLQGQTGPDAELRGYGLQVQGMSGMSSLIGWPEGPPTGVSLAYPDYVVPFAGAFAVVAALDHRDRTGEGQHIDLSQMETMLNVTGTALLDYDVNGRTQLRAGNRYMGGDAPQAAPHGVYPTKGDDRWIAISVFDDAQWEALCRVLDRESWRTNFRLATLDARCANDAALDIAIAEATASHDGRELMDKLQAAGVPAGVVLDQEGLYADPQLNHRGHFVDAEHCDWGPYKAELFGVRLADTPPVIQRPSPCIAQDNEYVLQQILGYSADEFNDLVADGAVEYYGAD
jgi:benzylsuccinate CoA-transferase BbsF subunit